jgi:hypothetical protein
MAMGAKTVAERPMPTVAGAHAARIAMAGSACHPYVEDLGRPVSSTQPRDLDDAIHLLCSLYGRHPGLIELTLVQSTSGSAQEWLRTAAEAFERERLYLVRLTAAVGPMPSTPGNAETEAAMLAQRHALETLARSERFGCALGATTALVADWRSIRPLLDRAAARVGVGVASHALPDEQAIGMVLTQAGETPAAERAIRFGAEQLLLQHRALWDLLEARCEAREGF